MWSQSEDSACEDGKTEGMNGSLSETSLLTISFIGCRGHCLCISVRTAEDTRQPNMIQLKKITKKQTFLWSDRKRLKL